MKGRIMLGAGLAAGYVLGARAGRTRYDSLRHAAMTVSERPEVQQVAGVLQARASHLLGLGRRSGG